MNVRPNGNQVDRWLAPWYVKRGQTVGFHASRLYMTGTGCYAAIVHVSPRTGVEMRWDEELYLLQSVAEIRESWGLAPVVN